ncbi:ABC transporter ATP-binding protein [Sulfoacidibacillus thermotolerans]|uniref:ABC transporter domain-containing protein n=1 Tax=Sulfoacidibacillus thermotolerans TaxID=1765684 RepID=A0A2U3DBU9_SULT2|nr:ATP-binding cassette domain-containing protein [Sulfoacidibacillus thermotolerans]PWI58754.1 hypothetical protein BM613_01265 [Sulfoacidibacillus thermotolerans]
MERHEVIVKIDRVSVLRQGRPLLQEIQLQTKIGEHWALLGANGAGKTTLLQIVLGMLWPTEGDVWVMGHHLGEYDVRELRKDIGFVSNRIDSYLEQNVQAVDLVASGKYATNGNYVTPTTDDLKKAQDLLCDLAAQQIATRPYALLSQGERQKVMIARALMADPKLLIIDEPCTGLDFPSREHVLFALQNLAQGTIPQLLYVTHYPEEIFPGISHVAILKEGRLLAAGLKQDVLTQKMLSEAYGLSVSLHWQDDRPVVRVKHDSLQRR